MYHLGLGGRTETWGRIHCNGAHNNKRSKTRTEATKTIKQQQSLLILQQQRKKTHNNTIMTSSNKTDHHTMEPTSTESYAVATPVSPTETYIGTPQSSIAATSATASHSQQFMATKPEQPQQQHTLPVILESKYIFIDSRNPVTLSYCPQCSEKHVTTKTQTKANGITAICVVAGLFIFWPLCWLPLCIKPLKQTNHYCTQCGAKVGRVKPFQ